MLIFFKELCRLLRLIGQRSKMRGSREGGAPVFLPVSADMTEGMA